MRKTRILFTIRKMDTPRFYCVLDFEANFFQLDPSLTGKARKEQNSRFYGNNVIVEFPSVLYDTIHQNVVSEFHRYVYTEDVEFFQDTTALTGVTREQFEAGIPLAQALHEHEMWLCGYVDPHSPEFRMATCGDWDLKTMLPRHAKRERLVVPQYLKSWINIKVMFRDVFYEYDKTQGTSMAKMLSFLKLSLVGRHHSGLDDCRNLVNVLHAVLARKASNPLNISEHNTRDWPELHK